MNHEKNIIILPPVEKEPTLETLLSGSPKAKLTKTAEDREWLTD